MKHHHQILFDEIERKYIETGEFYTIAALKEHAKKLKVSLGSDKAAELIKLAKESHSNDPGRTVEAMAALVEISASQAKSEIDLYATTKPLSKMNKKELCIGVCALLNISYIDAKKEKVEDLRKMLSKARNTRNAASFRRQISKSLVENSRTAE